MAISECMMFSIVQLILVANSATKLSIYLYFITCLFQCVLTHISIAVLQAFMVPRIATFLVLCTTSLVLFSSIPSNLKLLVAFFMIAPSALTAITVINVW